MNVKGGWVPQDFHSRQVQRWVEDVGCRAGYVEFISCVQLSPYDSLYGELLDFLFSY
jgi:hypothetical protein